MVCHYGHGMSWVWPFVSICQIPDQELVQCVLVQIWPQAQEVLRIQAKFIRSRDTSIVAVVKCTERFKTIGDFAFLDEVATKPGLSDLAPRQGR